MKPRSSSWLVKSVLPGLNAGVGISTSGSLYLAATGGDSTYSFDGSNSARAGKAIPANATASVSAASGTASLLLNVFSDAAPRTHEGAAEVPRQA